MEKAADVSTAKDDEKTVCVVCGKPLESWEQAVRDGSPVCAYHDDRWDKD